MSPITRGAGDAGRLPGAPFFDGLGPVEESAEQLPAYVDKVLAATDIVSHSQGGMLPRHHLKFLGGAAKVNALAGVAPGDHGTTPPLLTRLDAGGDTVPGARHAHHLRLGRRLTPGPRGPAARAAPDGSR